MEHSIKLQEAAMSQWVIVDAMVGAWPGGIRKNGERNPRAATSWISTFRLVNPTPWRLTIAHCAVRVGPREVYRFDYSHVLVPGESYLVDFL